METDKRSDKEINTELYVKLFGEKISSAPYITNVPDFCSSWEACGRIIEKFGKEFSIKLDNGCDSGLWFSDWCGPIEISTEAETPQRAIALAALRALEGEN
jgi:hypothetical protein